MLCEPDPTQVLYVRIKLYTWMPISDAFLDHAFASTGQSGSAGTHSWYQRTWKEARASFIFAANSDAQVQVTAMRLLILITHSVISAIIFS